MEKLFSALAKPAKWIFIIGGFVYALWFAIQTGLSINGSFTNVLANIVILFVGTGLLVIPPLFLLLKKEELAKIIFVLLLGYWVFVTILVFVVLQLLFGLKVLRPITNLIALIVVGACILAAILFIILAAIRGADWSFYVRYALMDMMVLPVTVGAGCLYFFNAQK